jgi:hypothetical protein
VCRTFDDGIEIDRFSPMPENHVPFGLEHDATVVATIHRQLAGDPARLAALFHRPVETIAPYLVQLAPLDPEPDAADLPKAHPDDEYDRYDCWSFIDFWGRLGITYPTASIFAHVITFTGTWRDVLPTALD